jgi:hypothetical protein
MGVDINKDVIMPLKGLLPMDTEYHSFSTFCHDLVFTFLVPLSSQILKVERYLKTTLLAFFLNLGQKFTSQILFIAAHPFKFECSYFVAHDTQYYIKDQFVGTSYTPKIAMYRKKYSEYRLRQHHLIIYEIKPICLIMKLLTVKWKIILKL